MASIPLPAAATLTGTTLVVPGLALAAGQRVTLLYVDDAGAEIPLSTWHADAAPAPTLTDTDALPEGTTNLYYTDSRTDNRVETYFHDTYFENLGYSPAAFPFPPVSDVVEVNPRTRNVYGDSGAVAVTYDVLMPTGDSSGGAGDYGTMAEFYYPALVGGPVTLNFLNGVTVDGKASLKMWPGDLLAVAREAVGPPPAVVKKFKLIRATNNKFSGQASTGFIPNSSQPATPAGGGILYVENGALKYLGSNGTPSVVAPA